MPLIYHFTDIDNVPRIIKAGALTCHRDAPTAVDIGNKGIKSNRETIEVPCGPGGKVGDYVPFYYARQVPMLSSIMHGNVEGVSSDQRRLVYFVSSTELAYGAGLQCVFTDGNAGTFHITKFENDPQMLPSHVDWPLMKKTYWANTPEDGDRVRRRMAEFLIHEAAPLEIFLGIAVMNAAIEGKVATMLEKVGRDLRVVRRPDWYFLIPMVEFVAEGNLLEADVDALVNTVNTKGVMGKGIALQFKRAFTSNYAEYRAACDRGEVRLGRMFVTATGRLDGPRMVINFPTKKHWKSRSRLADIDSGLQDLRRVLVDNDVKSVAVPPLGCGLGGLNWSDVKPRIESALNGLQTRVLVFEPAGAPEPSSMVDRRKRPAMTPGRAAFVGLMSRYLTPGESASPLVAQKLLYFLQEAGEDLKLDFGKQQYGPYADQVRHAVLGMEGHFVSGFGDGTGSRDIELMPGAVDEAEPFLADHPATVARFDRVAELIRGFESPYGLELLATTHWVATRDAADVPERAVELVREWSARKGNLFTADHIVAAWQQLEAQGWLPQRVLASAN